MSNFTLALMLTTERGRWLTRDLVLGAIDYNIKTKEVSVNYEVVSATLVERCSHLFDSKDIAYYKVKIYLFWLESKCI